MFEKGKEHFRSPRFFRTVKITGRQYSSVMSLADGSPLLMEIQAGKGKVLFAASGIDEKWSDLGYTTIFAPLILRSAAYLASHFKGDEDKRVGESLDMSLESDYFDTSFYIEKPSGETVSVLPEISGQKRQLRLQRTEQSGHYRFFHGEDLLGFQSVNIDPEESDLSAIGLSELQNTMRFPLRRISNIEKLDSVVAKVRYGRELWREIMLMALLILIVEMVLSHGSRVSSNHKK